WLDMIVLLEPSDGALHFRVEAGGGGSSGSGVGPRAQTQLAEERNLRGEIGIEMQNELPFVEAAPGPPLVGRCEVDVAETGDLQRRVADFRAARRRRSGVMPQMGGCSGFAGRLCRGRQFLLHL